MGLETILSFARTFTEAKRSYETNTIPGLKVVQEGNYRGVVPAIISQPLANMGPFFNLRGHCRLYDRLGFG